MTRTKGQTSEEDIQEAISRFIDSDEQMRETWNPQSWRDFLEDKLGYDIMQHPAAIQFWESVRSEAKGELGINVTQSPVTGQTVFRIAAGQEGAGRFMSFNDVVERISNWKEMLGLF